VTTTRPVDERFWMAWWYFDQSALLVNVAEGGTSTVGQELELVTSSSSPSRRRNGSSSRVSSSPSADTDLEPPP